MGEPLPCGGGPEDRDGCLGPVVGAVAAMLGMNVIWLQFGKSWVSGSSTGEAETAGLDSGLGGDALGNAMPSALRTHGHHPGGWSLLPVEILEAVAGQAPVAGRLREVCHSWRDLISSRYLELRARRAAGGFDPGMWLPNYQTLRLLHLSAQGAKGLTDAGLAVLASSLPCLMELALESCPDASEAGICCIAKLSSLTTLSLSWCAVVTSAVIGALGASLTGLLHLDLEGSEKLKSLRGLRDLRGLQSLRLQYCCQLEDTTLDSLLSLSSLTELSLGWCPELTCEGLTPLSAITSLTAIGLQEMELSTLAALEPITALRSLHLDEAQVTETAAAGLGRLTSLDSLSLCWCHSFTDLCASGLGALTGLTLLKAAWCQQLSARGVQHVRGMTGLRVLNLANCQVSNSCLETIACLRSLTDLNLSGAERITDDGLRALGDGLSCLKQLSLRGCRLITQAGLASLVPLADCLEGLSLRGCCSIAEGGAARLADLSCLQHLNLKDCDALQFGGLWPMSRLGLHTLDLGRCQWVSASGLAEVLRPPLLASIRVLKLKGCSALDDMSIRGLQGVCLRLLDVRYCNQLSQEVLQWAKGQLGKPCEVRRDVPTVQRAVSR